ncbi:PDK repeat-containing protein [Belliella baltica DSM 15883]|uniref:PDK repeat-containing protein n=1 Tax=Belliella baltica (strain DSM 15883 / CIP 108006 / LMG 21964 / BA134) TaxID=866536 RepID=I3Z5K3_BELBD|nr:T9SS C-terminal target domain-containing protein [Belliella baltica]AFL84521.1 PDK repeat-containing protein [Belliella baltica DSM 15883]
MANQFKSIFLILFLYSFLIVSSSVSIAQVGFPYCENFAGGSTQSSTVFGGSAILTSGVLQLTSNQNDQSGFVYIDIPFSSTFGIKASFEYFCYGGTGADGLTAFLFDGTVTNFNPGGFGGSLGYARRNNEPGLSGAYLGIGFDTFGNFGNNTESRIGGFPGIESGFHPNSIVVRGPGQGISGYQFIVGKKVNEGGVFGLPINQRFPLSSGGQGTNRVTDPQNSGFRQVFLNLEPNPNDVGYLLTVEMLVTTEAGNPRMVSIFNQEPYSFEAPDQLKIGFAASTGGENNFHEIRNVIVEVSNDEGLLDPVGEDIDGIASCAGQENTYDLFNTNILLPNENSSLRCIQFFESLDDIISEGEDICSQGNCRPENRELILPQGVFKADLEGGGFTFFPNSEFIGETVEVFYTITDNYGKTSSGNSIRLLVQESPAPVSIESELLTTGQNEIRLCEGESVVLVAVGEEEYVRYQWFFEEELIEESVNSEIQVSEEGGYRVVAFNSQNCSIESEIIKLKNPEFPSVQLATPIIGCELGVPLDIRSFIIDYDILNFDYQLETPEGLFLENEELAEINDSGLYLIRIKDKDLLCWSDPIEIEINVIEEPLLVTFDYEVDGTGIKSDAEGGIFIDDPIRFISESSGGAVSWSWDFGNGNTSEEENPVHVFGKKGTFQVSLTVSNAIGCERTFELNIELTQSYRVMFPTGFTPNLRENNFFRPKVKGIAKMELSIFNIWGNLIFQTDELDTDGWDGRLNGELMPSGSYVYKVAMESTDGDEIKESGRFLLIR